MTNFDLDFNIDISNILEDFTVEQLIEELKNRGAEYREAIKKNKGLNIEPTKDCIISALIFRNKE